MITTCLEAYAYYWHQYLYKHHSSCAFIDQQLFYFQNLNQNKNITWGSQRKNLKCSQRRQPWGVKRRQRRCCVSTLLLWAAYKMVLLSALNKLKDFVVWSWTYLWAIWFLLVSITTLILVFRVSQTFLIMTRSSR